jgi:hypothetical protein
MHNRARQYSCLPALSDEGNEVLLGNADLPAEAMDRQLSFIDPAAHRPRRDPKALRRVGDREEARDDCLSGL